MKIDCIPAGILNTNCYLIEREEDILIVDPGGSADELISRIDRTGKPLTAILLTHSHFDHILAVPPLMKRYDQASLMIHAAETYQLSREGIHRFLSQADPALLQYIGEDFDFPEVTKALVHGDIICDGLFRVVHTPGHSPGSVCYYSESEGVLCSGDTLFRGTVGRSDLPGGDASTLMSSIKEQLLPLSEETAVYPGHGEATTLSVEKQHNPFLYQSRRFPPS